MSQSSDGFDKEQRCNKCIHMYIPDINALNLFSSSNYFCRYHTRAAKPLYNCNNICTCRGRQDLLSRVTESTESQDRAL